MDPQLRPTGIGAVGDVAWGTHFFLFYQTKEDLVDALVPYFKAGLEGGEFCLWVITDPLTESEGRSALRRSVPDFERHERRRSIEIVQGREWYMTGEDLDLERVARAWNDKADSALSRGYAGLRLSAGTAWIEKKAWKEFSKYEAEVNESITDKPMIALCTYPLLGSAAAEILDVARTHQFAVARRNRQWEIVETAELKQAKTEIQKLNDELEQRVAERTRELVIANEELQREMNERQRAEETLRVAQAQLTASFNDLRALNARLQRVREDERKQVAREIHDDLGQSLTSIKIELASLIRTLSADQISEAKARSILGLVDQTIQSVRRIATELRPGTLDDLGLVAAVEWAAEEFAARSGTTLRLDLPEEDLAIDQESATAIFRILQETLTNVTRHAEATQVAVRLGKEGDSFALEVHDNGKGISDEQVSGKTSLGILGMRERVLLLGGTLTISGAPGKGSTVRVLIPDSRRGAEET
jgi:signal transduction histidine kinase